jgi:hypothetical protein
MPLFRAGQNRVDRFGNCFITGKFLSCQKFLDVTDKGEV